MLDKLESIYTPNISDNNTNGIVVIIAQKEFVYTNLFMLDERRLNRRRMMLLQKFDKLDKLSLSQFDHMFKNLQKVDEIVTFEAEKYITEDKTLIQFLVENNIPAYKIGNISVKSISRSNYKSKNKYSSYEYTDTPDLEYANDLIRKYLDERDRYKLNALLLYNLTSARMKYNYNLDDTYNEIASDLYTDLDILRDELTKSLEADNKAQTKLYNYIKQIDARLDIPIDESELAGVSNRSKQLLERFIQTKKNCKRAISLDVCVRYSGNKKNSFYAIDSINKYKNVLSDIKDRYYMIQLETIYQRVGKTIAESLDNMGLTCKDLMVTETTKEARTEHINKLLNTIYNKSVGTDTLSHIMSANYLDQIYKVILELNSKKMILSFLDDMNIWILVPIEIDRDEALKYIKDAIYDTFLYIALFRVHICTDGIRRKQFVPYNDNNTIVVYKEEK